MDLSALLGAAGSATPWGAVLGGVFGFGKKWLDNKHAEKMAEAEAIERDRDRQHDINLIDKEIEKETTMASMALEETMFKTDALTLRATSGNQDKEISALSDVLAGATGFLRWFAGFIFVLVTAIQKLTRPGITFCLFCLTAYLFIEVNTVVGGLAAMTIPELSAIYSKIIYTVLSMTELAVTFWFVSRPVKR